MKSLQTIQKMCKVFHTLSLVAVILSFLWAGFSLIGLIFCAVWGELGGTVFGQALLSVISAEGLRGAICALLSDAVFAVTEGVLFLFARQYFQSELAEGTPFTQNGAVKIRHLGISTIVMPNVAVILSAVIYSCYGMQTDPQWSSGASTLLGVVLIILSLVFQYGAELETGRVYRHEID